MFQVERHGGSLENSRASHVSGFSPRFYSPSSVYRQSTISHWYIGNRQSAVVPCGFFGGKGVNNLPFISRRTVITPFNKAFYHRPFDCRCSVWCIMTVWRWRWRCPMSSSLHDHLHPVHGRIVADFHAIPCGLMATYQVGWLFACPAFLFQFCLCLVADMNIVPHGCIYYGESKSLLLFHKLKD